MNRRAPLIAGVASVLVALLVIFLLVLPKSGEVDQANSDLQKAQDEEISLDAQLRALQQAEANAPQTEADIAKLEVQVPPTADLPGLFRLLQGAADQAAVDFFSFSPGVPTPDATGSYSTISSSINVTGSYFAIDEYLFLLETLPRAAKVITISVSPSQSASEESGGSTSGSLGLTLTVEFYTTDASAGPGSTPGATEGTTTVPGA